jgi:hypothetical protein
MLCLTYGYVIVFIIILMLLSALMDSPAITVIANIASVLLLVYWVVGMLFPSSCEGYFGIGQIKREVST